MLQVGTDGAGGGDWRNLQKMTAHCGDLMIKVKLDRALSKLV